MEWSLFLPLILAGIAYAGFVIAAGVVSSRGNDAGAERIRDAGFVIVLATGVWIVILLLISLVNEAEEIWDMITITLVIAVFFAALLVVFFGLAQLFGLVHRAFSRRKRVTTPGS